MVLEVNCINYKLTEGWLGIENRVCIKGFVSSWQTVLSIKGSHPKMLKFSFRLTTISRNYNDVPGDHFSGDLVSLRFRN